MILLLLFLATVVSSEIRFSSPSPPDVHSLVFESAIFPKTQEFLDLKGEFPEAVLTLVYDGTPNDLIYARNQIRNRVEGKIGLALLIIDDSIDHFDKYLANRLDSIIIERAGYHLIRFENTSRQPFKGRSAVVDVLDINRKLKKNQMSFWEWLWSRF
jgi:hypothetical protein